MCHVAGIGVMAKIFGGKENSDNVLTLLLVKSAIGLLSRRRTKKELLAEQFLSRIVCLVCKCAHYAYSLFFSSWQRPIL